MPESELITNFIDEENDIPRLGRSHSIFRIRDHINAYFEEDEQKAFHGGSEGANLEIQQATFNAWDKYKPALCEPSAQIIVDSFEEKLLFNHARYQRRLELPDFNLYFRWNLWATGCEKELACLKNKRDLKKLKKIIKHELQKSPKIHLLRRGLEPLLNCPHLRLTIFMKARPQEDIEFFITTYQAAVEDQICMCIKLLQAISIVLTEAFVLGVTVDRVNKEYSLIILWISLAEPQSLLILLQELTRMSPEFKETINSAILVDNKLQTTYPIFLGNDEKGPTIN